MTTTTDSESFPTTGCARSGLTSEEPLRSGATPRCAREAPLERLREKLGEQIDEALAWQDKALKSGDREQQIAACGLLLGLTISRGLLRVTQTEGAHERNDESSSGEKKLL